MFNEYCLWMERKCEKFLRYGPAIFLAKLPNADVVTKWVRPIMRMQIWGSEPPVCSHASYRQITLAVVIVIIIVVISRPGRTADYVLGSVCVSARLCLCVYLVNKISLKVLFQWVISRRSDFGDAAIQNGCYTEATLKHTFAQNSKNMNIRYL